MSLVDTIQQMLNSLWQNALNNPSSAYYLPTIIAKSGFAPAGGYPAGDWTVGSITGDGGAEGAKNICMDTAPFGQIAIPTPGALPNLQLSTVVILNLTNVVMPGAPQASGPDGLTVTAVMNFTNLQISGNFVLTQQCCLSDDQVNCNPGTTNTQTGKGTFTLTLGQSTATVVSQITTIAPNNLTVQTTSISYVVDHAKMSTTVNVTNIDDPQQRANWNKQVELAMNQDSTQTVIIQSMNATLGSGTALQQIGQALTTNIDNYLKETHQYPYDSAFGAYF